MDDETLNQEAPAEQDAPLSEDAPTEAEHDTDAPARPEAEFFENQAAFKAPDEPEPEPEPESPTDQAIDHVISKGYSREAAEWMVAKHGAEAILAGKEGYQSAEDRQKEAVSSEHYCAVCGLELSSNDPNSCAPGKCVMRPVPERSFDPERAAREREHKIEK